MVGIAGISPMPFLSCTHEPVPIIIMNLCLLHASYGNGNICWNWGNARHRIQSVHSSLHTILCNFLFSFPFYFFFLNLGLCLLSSARFRFLFFLLTWTTIGANIETKTKTDYSQNELSGAHSFSTSLILDLLFFSSISNEKSSRTLYVCIYCVLSLPLPFSLLQFHSSLSSLSLLPFPFFNSLFSSSFLVFARSLSSIFSFHSHSRPLSFSFTARFLDVLEL